MIMFSLDAVLEGSLLEGEHDVDAADDDSSKRFVFTSTSASNFKTGCIIYDYLRLCSLLVALIQFAAQLCH